MFYSMIHLRWFPSGVNNLKFHLQESRMAPGGSHGKVTLIKAKWSPPAVKETNLYVPFHLFLLLWLCPQVVFNFLRPHELQHTRHPCPPLSWSLLRFMSIELVTLSNHLNLCHPLLFLSSIFPSNWFFTSGGQSIEASGSASILPKNIHFYWYWGISSFIDLFLFIFFEYVNPQD